jgi:DNA-binding winged helix-turn-helix (wHTH) protein
VDNRIAELRRALADDPGRPQWIATIPGQGYRFVARVDDVR